MSELLYQLALTQVPHIGDIQARLLLQHLGSAMAVFQAKPAALERIDGIGAVRAASINRFRDFTAAEKELAFLQRYNIRALTLTDAAYPRRLLHCSDAPSLLFYKGSADLNNTKVIAIVGTRMHTEYGKRCTEELISGLAPHGALIVSGMAYGIDGIAHRTALKQGLPTVGVVGHGLDKMYPPEHTGLARELLQNGGGLLTEFWSGTSPDRFNFPLRNRIVAGMCDATVVIETGKKGGSMITAQLADSYNRDVFALPGRTTDVQSSGCNHLIQHQKAMLLGSAAQLVQAMGWQATPTGQAQRQPRLFPELSATEQGLVTLLQEKAALHIDEIYQRSGFTATQTAAAMLNLELNNLVVVLPGKLYKLNQ